MHPCTIKSLLSIIIMNHSANGKTSYKYLYILFHILNLLYMIYSSIFFFSFFPFFLSSSFTCIRCNSCNYSAVVSFLSFLFSLILLFYSLVFFFFFYSQVSTNIDVEHTIDFSSVNFLKLTHWFFVVSFSFQFYIIYLQFKRNNT